METTQKQDRVVCSPNIQLAQCYSDDGIPHLQEFYDTIQRSCSMVVARSYPKGGAEVVVSGDVNQVRTSLYHLAEVLMKKPSLGIWIASLTVLVPEPSGEFVTPRFAPEFTGFLDPQKVQLTIDWLGSMPEPYVESAALAIILEHASRVTRLEIEGAPGVDFFLERFSLLYLKKLYSDSGNPDNENVATFLHQPRLAHLRLREPCVLLLEQSYGLPDKSPYIRILEVNGNGMDEDHLGLLVGSCLDMTKLKVTWDFDFGFVGSFTQNLINQCPPKIRQAYLGVYMRGGGVYLPEVPRAALDFTSLCELEELAVPAGWCFGSSALELSERLPRSALRIKLMYCERNKATEEQIAALKRGRPELIVEVEMMNEDPQIVMVD